MELEEKLCDEEETLREFTYLGNSKNVGGGCEAAVYCLLPSPCLLMIFLHLIFAHVVYASVK